MEDNTIYDKNICTFCHIQCSNPGSTANHIKHCDLNPIHLNKNYECKSIFLDNKYTTLYFNIIKSSIKNYKLKDGYFEYHHILPRSLNGSNSKYNIAKLTSKQHFICHYLLTKMIDENDFRYKKMILAFNMMSSESSDMNRYINSKLYSISKNQQSKIMSSIQAGTNNSNYGMKWITNPTLKENKSINKNANIPFGWYIGRCDYNKTKPILYNNGINEKLFYKFNIETGYIKGKLKIIIEKPEKIDMSTFEWNIIMFVYYNYGFDSVLILCNIDFKSRNNLMMSSKRYNKNHYSNQNDKKNINILSFKI